MKVREATALPERRRLVLGRRLAASRAAMSARVSTAISQNLEKAFHELEDKIRRKQGPWRAGRWHQAYHAETLGEALHNVCDGVDDQGLLHGQTGGCEQCSGTLRGCSGVAR